MIEYTNKYRRRVKKYLRQKYKMSDDELNAYLIMKHHLDHSPTRDEIMELEHIVFYRTFLT